MSYVEAGSQVLLATVFAWSAWSKLRSRTAFQQFARSLTPLVRSATPVAVVLAATELAVPLLVLVIPVWGFAVASSLLAVLGAGAALVVRRRLVVQCRCFAAKEERIGPRQVVRNLVLLAVGVLGLSAALVPGGGRLELPGVLLAAGAAVVLSTLVIRFDDVVDLFA